MKRYKTFTFLYFTFIYFYNCKKMKKIKISLTIFTILNITNKIKFLN